MTSEELRDVEVGDRLKWVGKDGPVEGTVVEKRYGFAHIEWDDGAKKLVIGWRSKDDRAIAKNLERVVGERRDVVRPDLVEVVYGVHKDPSGRKGYVFRSDIPGLAVGDVVLVPGSWVNPGHQEATVKAVGASYEGTVSLIVGLVRKAGQGAAEEVRG